MSNVSMKVLGGVVTGMSVEVEKGDRGMKHAGCETDKSRKQQRRRVRVYSVSRGGLSLQEKRKQKQQRIRAEKAFMRGRKEGTH